MCGIFGYVGRISKEHAEFCTQKLQHRGPDGLGLWTSDAASLGHRRLTLVDLSTNASQPMTYASERYVLTYNGEIYNFPELREELEEVGYRFRTVSDTEVLLLAFVHWGSECLQRLNGMWAFAVWDAHARRLFLSRDRFGKKPLFYSFVGSGFAFASEMKALLPLFDEVKVHEGAFVHAFQMHLEGTDQCLIEGILRFPSGSYGVYEQGRLRVTRFWNTREHLITVPEAYEEQQELFRELFFDACKIRMRGDVAIASCVSGGLDSSSVAAGLNMLSALGASGKNSYELFHCAFPGSWLDESEYAWKVADHLGKPLHVVNVDVKEAVSQIERYVYLFEECYHTSHLPFMFTYQYIARQGNKCLLEGHGADELFGGYHFLLLEALKDAKPCEWLSVLQMYLSCSRKESGGKGVLRLLGSLKAVVMVCMLKSYPVFEVLQWCVRRWPFVGGLLRGIDWDYLKQQRIASKSSDRSLGVYNTVLYGATHDTILPTLLRNYDRYSMSSGVEIRMPFLDHRIVSLAFSLPYTSKIAGGFTKSIVRDAMKDYLPRDIVYRKDKVGWCTPSEWLDGPFGEYMCDVMSSQDFKACAYVEYAEVQKGLDSVRTGNYSHALFDYLWKQLNTYLWIKTFIRTHTQAIT